MPYIEHFKIEHSALSYKKYIFFNKMERRREVLGFLKNQEKQEKNEEWALYIVRNKEGKQI